MLPAATAGQEEADEQIVLGRGIVGVCPEHSILGRRGETCGRRVNCIGRSGRIVNENRPLTDAASLPGARLGRPAGDGLPEKLIVVG